jgi:hypothetical protein
MRNTAVANHNETENVGSPWVAHEAELHIRMPRRRSKVQLERTALQ